MSAVGFVVHDTNRASQRQNSLVDSPPRQRKLFNFLRFTSKTVDASQVNAITNQSQKKKSEIALWEESLLDAQKVR
ncbi:hypothetical protein AZE42_11293 [Rhizopogon vesiculosus]|uniref:Uncharacterized protein n=1 Tax=Rhizopogon vesiculosus TaxID=180088 RepID=A0A1J8PHA2_9AGAM|nr:hypothetical protein AZE42_11293 [Rhizopogon vesiculosus]